MTQCENFNPKDGKCLDEGIKRMQSRLVKIPLSIGNCANYPNAQQARKENESRIIELEAQARLTNLIQGFTPVSIQDFWKQVKPLSQVEQEAYQQGFDSVGRKFLEKKSKWDERRRAEGEKRKSDAQRIHFDTCIRSANDEAAAIGVVISDIENKFLEEEVKDLTPVSSSNNSLNLGYWLMGILLVSGIIFFAYKIFKKTKK